MKRLSIIGLAVIMVMGLAATSWATSVSFTGTSGDLAASVKFDYDGSTTLKVTLTNTSSVDVMVPADVLTGVFFNTGGQSLSPVSAMLASGSQVFYGPDGGGNVGGEWAYKGNISPLQYGANAGISSAGLGIFGAPNFGGSNLQDPAAVDGLNYGLTSAGDNVGTGNAAVTGGVALIKNSVVFTFTVDAGFDLSKISGITFQYGTALDEPHFGVPEPSTFLLLGAGLLGVGLLRRKFRK